MNRSPLPRILLAILAPAALTVSAHAATLRQASPEQLAARNELVVTASVLDIHSYWNSGHTFILTDVRLRPHEMVKGSAPGDLTVTVLGGSVGDVTTLLVGGADLAPGADYLLFLSHADLPGAPGRLTVTEHAQGVFLLANGRAISEVDADSLLPGATGATDARDFAVDDLLRRVRAAAGR